jgi:hypothetical protein
MPKANDMVSENPVEPVPLDVVSGPADDAAGISPGLLRRSVAAVVKGVTGALSGFLYRKSIARGDSVKDAQALRDDLSPTQEELDSLAELTDILMKKYAVSTKYAPEACAVLLLGQIGARYAIAFKAVSAPSAGDKPK